MRIAYFDCISGISGDMVLGSFLDAGLDIKTLDRELGKLGVKGYAISGKNVGWGPPNIVTVSGRIDFISAARSKAQRFFSEDMENPAISILSLTSRSVILNIFGFSPVMSRSQ